MSTRRTDPAIEQNPQDEPADATPAAAGQAQAEAPAQKRGLGGWGISLGLHSIILASMAFVVFAAAKPDEPPPVHFVPLPPPAPEKPRKAPSLPNTPDTKVTADVADVTVDTPVTVEDKPADPVNADDPENTQTVNKGREDAVAVSEEGSSSFIPVLGPGASAPGKKGNPFGDRRQKALHPGPGGPGGPGIHGRPSRPSENAVEAALRWFKRHQSRDGGWEAVKYNLNCSDDPKCEPGGNEAGAVDPAMTGYALLCYIGAGYDHVTPNRYQAVVRHGLEKLLSVQDPDGRFGPRNYEHAVATMALAEAYAATSDPALKGPAQRGIDAILRAQNQAGDQDKDRDHGYGTGMGWDYVNPTTRNDSSVSGWNVMALKSGLAAGLTIGNGLEGAKHWLDRTWKATNPGWAKLDPYTGESRFPYTWDTGTQAVQIAAAPAAHAKSADAQDLTCVGLACAIFLGHHAGDPMVESLSNQVMDHELPTAWPCNTYKLYYNTLSMFQVGGKRFDAWDTQVRDMLVAAQHRDGGCFDGSWDWNGTAFPGNQVGRVLSTAFCCLSLEVYYRHEKLDQGKAQQ
jgi:hypothetical protein